MFCGKVHMKEDVRIIKRGDDGFVEQEQHRRDEDSGKVQRDRLSQLLTSKVDLIILMALRS